MEGPIGALARGGKEGRGMSPASTSVLLRRLQPFAVCSGRDIASEDAFNGRPRPSSDAARLWRRSEGTPDPLLPLFSRRGSKECCKTCCGWLERAARAARRSPRQRLTSVHTTDNGTSSAVAAASSCPASCVTSTSGSNLWCTAATRKTMPFNSNLLLHHGLGQ